MNRHLHNSLFLFTLALTLLIRQEIMAQPGAVGTNNLNGSPFTCTTLTDLGTFKQARIQATQSSVAANCEFPSGCGYPGDVWRAYTATPGPITLNTTVAPVTGTGSGALYNSSNGGSAIKLPATTINRYYTFNIEDKPAPNNLYMAVLETPFNPVAITAVSTCTSNPAANQIVQINITTASAPASGENIFVRYSTNAFATSSAIVQANFTGTSGKADIPAQVLGTTVTYYVYSSNRTLAAINADVATYGQLAHNMSTLNLNNNSGFNYNYTVNTTSVILPGINPGGPTTFCPGGSVTLTVVGSFSSYQWNSIAGNATTNSVVANATGTYTVTVTYSSGCTASASQAVNATDSTPPTIVCPTIQTVVLNSSCTASLPTYTPTTLTDNCGTPTSSQSPAVGAPVSGVGTTTVTLTGNDGYGNTATCAFTVNRVDNTPPTITCPATQSLVLGATTCAATLSTYNAASTSDNCSSSISVSQSPTVGTPVSGLGATTVTLTANDSYNNTASCSFTVNRVDNTPPIITCPTVIQPLLVDGNCNAFLPSYSPLTLSDNCASGPSYTQAPASGTISGAGTTTVVLTANDGNGNTATCSFSVTRIDNIPPSITCPTEAQSFPVDGSCNISLPAYTAVTASDNCGTPTVTQSPAAGVVFGGGTLTVTLTATDASSNTANCTFLVNRIDVVPPVITCPGTQTIALGANCTIPMPTYTGVSNTDNCGGTPTILQIPQPGNSISGKGNTTVVLTALDSNGNTGSCSFTVTTVDSTPPAITCPPAQNITLNGSCAGILPAYSAVSVVDNCTGTVSVTQSPPSGTALTGTGVTTVTLSTVDADGNTANCSFVVNKLGNTTPSITCPGTQTVFLLNSCSATLPAYVAPIITAPCGTPALLQSPAAGSTVTGIGLSTVTLTANNGGGSTATCSFSINKIDATPPTITCPGNQTLVLNNTCSAALPGYSAASTADNCASSVSVTQSPAANTVVTGVGTTTVTLNAADGNGNTASCSFSVARVDNTPPTITCPGTQNLVLNSSCSATLPLYSAASKADNCSGNPTVTQLPLSGTNVSGTGVTTITLTATDASNNTATCSFSVNRLDTSVPTIVCPGTQNLVTNTSCVATFPTYSALAVADNCSTPVVTQSPAAGSTVSGLGASTVTLTATDASNNTATCSFFVNRLDVTPPSITCPGTQTLPLGPACSATMPSYITAASSTDNCGSPAITQFPLSGTNYIGLGTTTVVLTANDGNGNTNSCSFTVNRVDNTIPSITCPATQTLTLNATCNATLPGYTIGSSADNCGTPVVTQSPASGTVFTGVGSSIVTLTANDGNGNTNSCSFTVNRTDTSVPTITCPAAQTISFTNTCTAILPSYITAATSADNCGSPSITQVPTAGSQVSGVGSTTIVLTANDGNGNTASCSFAVNQVDNTPPSLSCPSTQSLVLGNSCTAIMPDYATNSSSDNCSIPVVVQVPAWGSILTGVGTTTVTLTSTDDNNNSNSCSFTVQTIDTQPPVLSPCPANIITCSSAAAWIPPTATDNCGVPVITTTYPPGSSFGSGTTTVVYTATDAANNIATCSFTVTYVALVASTTNSSFNGSGVSCYGGNNGSATVSVSSGTPPYTYLWSNGATTTTVNNLTAGNYTVTIQDGAGCTQVKQVNITQPPLMNCSAVSSASSCDLNNGTITTTTFGGKTPYSYNLLSGVTSLQTNASGFFSNLAPGTYSVQVTDANGCVCSVASVTVVNSGNGNNGPLLGNAYEGGGSTSIPTLYNIAIIEITGGAFPYQYSWSTIGYTNYSVQQNTAGTGVNLTIVYADNASWSLTVTDSNNCAGSQLVYNNTFIDGGNTSLLVDIVDYTITADFGTTNGTISLQIEGGTPCPGTSPYNYQWAGPLSWAGTFTNSPNQTGLQSGWYTVTVADCGGQETISWFWVPKKERGRGKDALSNEMLQIAPNPFVNSTTIHFSWPQDDELQLEIYDLMGKLVQTPFTGAVNADAVYTFNFDAKDLPDGVYLCRLINKQGWEIHSKIMHLQTR